MTIRLNVPSIADEDIAAVAEVLRTGFLVQGRRVAEFEEAVAKYLGVDYSVAVSNCTAALYLSLQALGTARGDRVAVTAYSWPATANAIELLGAEPVFIDIDARTFNIDASRLEAVVRRGGIKAILPVHAFGGIADMDAIVRIGDRSGVHVLEDAACAIGADLNGRKAGSWGTLSCFSFHPRKAITTGEGGIVAGNDPALIRRLRILRNHGQDPDAISPDFVEPGHNMRLTEFQAALGTVQLTKLERIIDARRVAAQRYKALLQAGPMTSPKSQLGSRHVYQSYVVLLPPEVAPRRGALISALREQGIETTIGTYHIPMTRYYRSKYGHQTGDFPVTDDVNARALSLPLSEGLTADEQIRVVTAISAML